MIGQDFDKIEFSMFGLDLLEPMALITDTIMGGLSLFFFLKLLNINSKIGFYKYWKLFFFAFGVGAILGGIGHTFFNQLGIPGKFLSWIFGPISIYFAERAMIESHWDNKKKSLFKTIANFKMFVAYIAFLILLFFVANQKNISTLPFIPIAINTIVGMIFIVANLGFKYTEKFSAKFKFFWLGVLVMLPTAFIFLMKINIHPWFDKNDFSHILFIIGITYFYLGVSKISLGLK